MPILVYDLLGCFLSILDTLSYSSKKYTFTSKDLYRLNSLRKFVSEFFINFDIRNVLKNSSKSKDYDFFEIFLRQNFREPYNKIQMRK